MEQKLIITLTEAGQLGVEGDVMNNKQLAYGLLEVAKEAIKNLHDEMARKIKEATPAERLALLGAGFPKG